MELGHKLMIQPITKEPHEFLNSLYLNYVEFYSEKIKVLEAKRDEKVNALFSVMIQLFFNEYHGKLKSIKWEIQYSENEWGEYHPYGICLDEEAWVTVNNVDGSLGNWDKDMIAVAKKYLVNFIKNVYWEINRKESRYLTIFPDGSWELE